MRSAGALALVVELLCPKLSSACEVGLSSTDPTPFVDRVAREMELSLGCVDRVSDFSARTEVRSVVRIVSRRTCEVWKGGDLIAAFSLAGTDEDDAIRLAEYLRAHARAGDARPEGIPRSAAPAPIAPVAATKVADERMWSAVVAVGPAFQTSSSELALFIEVERKVWKSLSVGMLGVSSLVTIQSAERAAGSVTLASHAIGPAVGAELVVGAVSFRANAGMLASLLHVGAESAPGFAASSTDRVTALPFGALGATAHLSSLIGIDGGALVGFSLPPIAVRSTGSEIGHAESPLVVAHGGVRFFF